MSDSSKSMKVKVGTKQQILGIIMLIILLVGVIGVYAYRQFSEVVTKVSETTLEDPAVSKTHRVLFNITRAENQIRRYTLTEDSVHLEQFGVIRSEVDTLLTELVKLEPVLAESIRIDTFEVLVKERFELLNEIATTQDAFRVEEAFNNVSTSIPENVSTSPPVEKRRRLFNRSSRKDAEKAKSDLAKLNESIREVQEKETLKEENQIENELNLLIDDNKNALALQSIVDKIELEEANNDQMKVEEVSSLVKRTNSQVIIFCIVICLLLLVTSFTFLKYIRRNSIYRLMLNRAKNEAESLANAKALFVATVSHEIRTPINIIAGFSEQLDESDLTDQQQEQLTGIRQSSSHLLDLVNSVLDFTKLENDHIELENSAFSPNELLSTLDSLLSQLKEENDTQLEFNLDQSVPPVLFGDAFRLRQILLNLVGNAIKFTRGGKVDITFDGVPGPDSTFLLNITVRDNGIGMSSDQLLTVFDEFVQANKSTTRLYGGTGLGLPITKKLIELQNGTIEIDSEEGVGTSVQVEIPLSTGELSDLELDSETTVKLDLHDLKILVVDDEPFNRKLIRTILSKQNASIIDATDGREAISAVETQTFDLILMDIQMPQVGGVEASKRIQKISPKTPIIALTAALAPDQIKEYTDAGMVSHLAKPFKQTQLLMKLAEVLSLSVETVEQVEQIEESTGTPNKQLEDHISFEDLRNLSAGDTAFYTEMLETFEKSTQEGVQAIQVAAAKKNWKTAGENAHKICAACKHLSANTLYQYLKQIEENCLNEKNLDEIPEIVKSTVAETKRVLEIIQNERSAIAT